MNYDHFQIQRFFTRRLVCAVGIVSGGRPFLAGVYTTIPLPKPDEITQAQQLILAVKKSEETNYSPALDKKAVWTNITAIISEGPKKEEHYFSASVLADKPVRRNGHSLGGRQV
jgi:hypothetical protein